MDEDCEMAGKRTAAQDVGGNGGGGGRARSGPWSGGRGAGSGERSP